MRHFSTRDDVTNANLRYLESCVWVRPDMEAEDATEKFRAAITVQDMLPAAVRQKFAFPSLYIGDAAYRWSPDQRQQRVQELVEAIEDGLDAVLADPSLGKNGNANFSDRPASKGEEVRAAIEEVRQCRGTAQVGALRSAAYGTNLSRYVERLDHWLNRKRPSPNGNSIEYEIACVIGDIARRVDEYHHLRASPDFQQRRSVRLG